MEDMIDKLTETFNNKINLNLGQITNQIHLSYTDSLIIEILFQKN